MANTRTPRPPAPFGSTAQYQEQLVRQQSIGVRPVTPEQLASVNQLQDLLGAQLRSELALRGDLGTRDPIQRRDGTLTTGTDRIRTPFVLTCQKWIEQQRYIVAAVNPSEIGWRLPQRAAQQKTRIGEITHYWRDRFRGTFFDEPQLSITFQSGNIMPMRTKPLVPANATRQTIQAINPETGEIEFITVSGRQPDPSERTPQMPPGLDNFYEFLELIDEQKILDNGETNLVYIMYNSRIFPNITLAGLFTPEGASWSDSANDPNQVNSWTATFTVYDSFPRLNDKAALVKMFELAGWGRV